MKLLLENWREYAAQEDSELSETIEKLLQMEFSQAISLINALKTSESDNYLEARYRVALEREYGDSQKELAYWRQKLDPWDQRGPRRWATQKDEDWRDFYEVKKKHRRLEAKWKDMNTYFAEHDEL